MVFEKILKKKKNESKDNSTCYYNIRVVLWNTPIHLRILFARKKERKKKIKIENISAAVCMCFHARVGHLKSLIAFF